MTQRLVNARIVTEDRMIEGALAIEDGIFIDVTEATGSRNGLDVENDLLIPGLIDLHTDNLERHFQPRAGVTWDGVAAAISHDAQIATSGITTVFDSLTIGAASGWDARAEMVAPMVDGLNHAIDHSMLRVDHRLHLRCEITHPDLPDIFDTHASQTAIDMASIMDHAPGDRQSPDIDAYRKRYQQNGMSQVDTETHITGLIEGSRRFGPSNLAAIADRARKSGIPLATHDDARIEHVDKALEINAAFSEFPTTMEAAQHASDHGLPVLMGSPNLVRGGSHSGNVSAAELAHRGLLDILASDHIPASLIKAAFKLAQKPFDFSLPQAIATVTSAPAKAAGLKDRGRIAPGLRADFLRVRIIKNRPIIREVWCAGARVA